ncbi:hypothetical protein DVH24_002230 [Malus domestica]|uniref:Uncharacterized protein n=1 Tax=Malus domestica TaxID=3750 RepID=A0A498I910_MALDO|nr:hypothetical protein DVH24_002230 [Malus domestica]
MLSESNPTFEGCGIGAWRRKKEEHGGGRCGGRVLTLSSRAVRTFFDGDLAIAVGIEAFEDLSGLLGDEAALVDASRRRNGTYQANRPEIDRRQGPKEVAGHQGSPEVCSSDRKSEEASPLQAGNGGAERDQEVPEEHGAPDPQAAIPKAGEGDRPGLQDQSEVPEQRRGGALGGGGGVLGGTVRGHQPKQLLKSIEPLLKRKSPADGIWVRAKNEMMSENESEDSDSRYVTGDYSDNGGWSQPGLALLRMPIFRSRRTANAGGEFGDEALGEEEELVELL